MPTKESYRSRALKAAATRKKNRLAAREAKALALTTVAGLKDEHSKITKIMKDLLAKGAIMPVKTPSGAITGQSVWDRIQQKKKG